MAKTPVPANTGKTETGSAVAVKPESAVPAFMQGHADKSRKMGNLDSGDMEVPRIKLLQMTSKEVAAGIGRAGQFFHNVVEEIIGEAENNVIKMTPIYIWKSFILWRPRHQNGGGILARAMDGKNWTPTQGEFTVQPYKDNRKTVTWKLAPTVEGSGLDAWGSTDPEDPNSPPAATKMLNILAHIHGYEHVSPVVVTLQRSAIKVGRKLVGKLQMSSAPQYGMILSMKSNKEANANNEEFFNYEFSASGMIQDEALFRQLAEMNERYEKTGVEIKDVEGLQGEGVGNEPGSSGGASTVDKRV